MEMTPLYWLYFGVALILLEVMTPGFVSLFFGLSAFTVALLVWLVPMAQGWQWLAFSIFSVAFILLLRSSVKRVFSGDREVSDNPSDEYTGKLGVVTEAIAPNRPGRIELGGTTWSAEADETLMLGASVKVLSKKNLTFRVKAV